ncbi:hypothetical protein FOCG_17773 [Fusarium oxysporum f. sp. radicis-lycopersici 26381]|nr:hypothetical protein FOCG_17773 [Fusarium oxysporum f. sp. radicis-lycopersici 26381]
MHRVTQQYHIGTRLLSHYSKFLVRRYHVPDLWTKTFTLLQRRTTRHGWKIQLKCNSTFRARASIWLLMKPFPCLISSKVRSSMKTRWL